MLIRNQSTSHDDGADRVKTTNGFDNVQREEAAWATAVSNSSIAAFRVYLRDYPVGRHVGDALNQLAALENEEWRIAIATNTFAAVSKYIADVPDGVYVGRAQALLRVLGAPGCREKPQTSDHEPAPGTLRYRQEMLIDDETCPPGCIKRIIGSNLDVGIPRVYTRVGKK
jgi:hypothetical protein